MQSTQHHAQIAHPHQVVRRHRQDKLEVQLLAADKPALSQPTDGLCPTKTLLDALAEALAGGIAGVAGGASIDRRRKVARILCDVGRNVGTSQFIDTAAAIVYESPRFGGMGSVLFIPHVSCR